MKESSKETQKPLAEQDGIPGARVVLWVALFVVGLPLICMLSLKYAQSVGATEGLRPDYRAMRDPLAWLFIVAVMVGCGMIARAIGRNPNNNK